MRENIEGLVKNDYHQVPINFEHVVKYRYVMVQKELNLSNLTGKHFILSLNMHKIETDLFEIRLFDDQNDVFILGCDPLHQQIIMKSNQKESVEPFDQVIHSIEMYVKSEVEIRINGEFIAKLPLELASTKCVQLRTINGSVKINEIVKKDI
jgi:hypothetical protein